MSDRAAVAILGGSFDPVHLAHIAAAENVVAAMSGVKVYLMPGARAPHKAGYFAGDDDRVAMLMLAIEGKKNIGLDLREIQSHRISYSVDSLSDIRDELGEHASISFIVGWDAWQSMPTWHRWQSLFSIANIIVVSRPGYCGKLPEALAHYWHDRKVEIQSLRHFPAGKVAHLHGDELDISSSSLRCLFARMGKATNAAERYNVKQALSECLNKNVMNYIFNHQLYGCEADIYEKTRK